MVSNRWRIVTWPILVAGLASPFLMDCGGMPGMDKLGALKTWRRAVLTSRVSRRSHRPTSPSSVSMSKALPRSRAA